MEIETPENIFDEKNFYYLQVFFDVILLILLLFFSAIISGVETALFSLDKKILEIEKKKDIKKFTKIFNLLKDQKKLLATILIINNFLNIEIVVLSSSLIHKNLLYFTINIYGLYMSFDFLIEIVGISFILLLFGEIIPKIYARKNNFNFAYLMYNPLSISIKIFTPLSNFMIWIYKLIKSKINLKKDILSVGQLSHALEITSSKDKKDREEQEFLQGIVDFGSIETSQIMTPRIDMFTLKYDTKFSEVLNIVISEGYSRVPVYKDNIDDIEGILFVKDLLPHINQKDYNWIELIHPPFFVPENKKLDDLLTDFKNKRIHLSIVVDEYGGTCGLVTLEDVIEEIVGDMYDEFDEENKYYSKIDDNRFVFEGKTPLVDFYRIMKINEEDFFEEKKGDADTLGGFIMEIHKEFPKHKDKIHFHNYIFIIQSIDKKRIKRIEIIRKKNNINENKYNSSR